MSTRILLARHGGTVWSREERFAGSTDIDLSEEGRLQAMALGRRLEHEQIDAAYCSPLKRAVDTATMGLGTRSLEIRRVPGLREIHHGTWEGQKPRDVRQQFPADYAAWEADPFLAAPPDGEIGLAVLARALPALRQIVADHPGQTVFVVSHKATNRLLLCSLLGIDGRFYRDRLTQELACLNVLVFKTPSDERVALMNDISHYSNLPP